MLRQKRAIEIVNKLRLQGFVGYFVGGSVRDLLLKRTPKDYDLVTDATPDEVAKIFPKHHAIGRKFGVLTAIFPEGTYEIATFRAEKTYEDKRRPKEVFWTHAREDISRRDFTVNGLLYDPIANKVVDYVHGQRDLELRVIRFIGHAKKRIQEDPVRILRAVRLKNKLRFQYDPTTYRALTALSAELKHVSLERVRDELNLMLSQASRLTALQDLDRIGALKILLPEIDALKGVPQPIDYHQEGDVYDHTLRALASLETYSPSFLIWAVLLHDSGKPTTLSYKQVHGKPTITTNHHAEVSAEIAEQVLRRLHFSASETDTIAWMIRHHMSLKDIEQMRPVRQEAYVLDPRFPWLLELHKADALGAKPIDLSLYARDLKLYEGMKQRRLAAIKLSPTPLLNGHILQSELALMPGPMLGELLEEVRNAQLQGLIRTPNEAIEYARALIKTNSTISSRQKN